MVQYFMAVLIAISLIVPFNAFGEDPLNSEGKDFVNLYRTYFDQKNLEKIFSLYYFSGTSELEKERLSREYKSYFTLKVSKLILTDATNDKFSAMKTGFLNSDGQLLVGNGDPTKQLLVEFDPVSVPEETMGKGKRLAHISKIKWLLPVGVIDGKYVLLSVKNAPESLIHKISKDQIIDFLQLAKAKESNWPTVLRGAKKTFNNNAQLPVEYQELFKEYKTRDSNNMLNYTLYKMREPGFYQTLHEITLRVYKQTGFEVMFFLGGISDIPIYDKYTIVGLNDSKKSIEVEQRGTHGNHVRVSKLNSTAAVSECDDSWTKDTLSRLQKGFSLDTTAHDGDWTITKVHDLIPINCATIEYNSISVAVMYFLLEGDNNDKAVKGNKFLIISTYNKNNRNLTHWIYTGVTNDSMNDSVTDLHVEAIADVNNDGLHDIVLSDSHYMRTDYIVLLYKGDGKFQRMFVRIADRADAEGD